MKSKGKIVSCNGKLYPCREILFGSRYSVYNNKAVCVATFVTLPKVYHVLSVEYMKPHDFIMMATDHIIYSYLFIKAFDENEASEIMRELMSFEVVAMDDPQIIAH